MMLPRSLACLLLLALPAARAGTWGLTEVDADVLQGYYQKFTGNLTGDLPSGGPPQFVPGTVLLFEQAGPTADSTWPHVLAGITSMNASIGGETIYTGVGYSASFPTRSCGPATDVDMNRKPGCTADLSGVSPFGALSDPGFGPAQWAYRGGELGPPVVLTGEDFLGQCNYSFAYESDPVRQQECRKAPARGGYPWPLQYSEGVAALRFSASGQALHTGLLSMQLPELFQTTYASMPLRWGFEEGGLAPFWSQLSPGSMPQLSVTAACLLSAHSGRFQLCSAYPWAWREAAHGLLHVRSEPFVLGPGPLTWQMGGGDHTVPDIPLGALDLAIVGEGVLGVALARVSDAYSRVAAAPARAERFWSGAQWTAQQLSPFVGDKFVLEVFDFRRGPWGWLALDSFLIPAAPQIIYSTQPSGGREDAPTLLTVTGSGFGGSVDGLTVFVGGPDEPWLECLAPRMVGPPQRSGLAAANQTLTCTVPPWPGAPGSGAGLTVSVVLGGRTAALLRGPFGGYQAGHCGSASAAPPFSACVPLDSPELPPQFGAPPRGFSFRPPPRWPPAALPPPCAGGTLSNAAAVATFVLTGCAAAAAVDVTFRFYPLATAASPKLALTYASALPLPSFLNFDTGEPATGAAAVLSGVPLSADAICPLGADCADGVPYTIAIAASDGFSTTILSFTLRVPTAAAAAPVAGASSASLPAAPSPAFSWALLSDFIGEAKRDVGLQYHLRVPDVLLSRLAPSNLGVGLQGARSPVEAVLITQLSAAADAPDPLRAAQLLALVAGAAPSGAAVAAGTQAARLRLALRAASDAAQLASDAAAALQAASYGQWFAATAAAAGAAGGVGFAASAPTPPGPTLQPQPGPGGPLLVGPPASNFSGGAGAAGAPVLAVPVGGSVARVDFSTLCSPTAAGDLAPCASLLPPSAARPAAASPAALAASHTLWIAYPAHSLRPADAALQPPDFPHADLLSHYLRGSGGDGAGGAAALLWALAERAAAAAARHAALAAIAAAPPQNVSGLAWSGSHTQLSFTVPSPLPPPSPPLRLVLELGDGWTAPHAGAEADALAWAPRAAARLLLLQGVPWHGEEARKALDALAAAQPASAPLADRLKALAAAAQRAAQRCANDCTGRGLCDASLFPPACACLAGAIGSDCAHTACPDDCSGRGACDSQLRCTPVPFTGETTCTGGSGQCACDGPTADGRQWTGASCATLACPSPLLVLRGLSTANLSSESVSANFTARGLSVVSALTSLWDGVPTALGAVPGDNYRTFSAFSGVAVLRFASAADAGVARRAQELASPSVPARGQALLAPLFAPQVADAAVAQRTVLQLFVRKGLLSASLTLPCSGRGACATAAQAGAAAGTCSCTAGYAGEACELALCPAACGGHGSCDTDSGACRCDPHYQPHDTLGCALVPLGLASSSCEDDARNDALLADGDRAAPIQLHCLLGVPLGSATAAGYCPPGVLNATASVLAAVRAGTLRPPAAACYTYALAGQFCAACSGYAVANASAIVLPSGGGGALGGVGALVNSTLVLHLSALRARGLAFTSFSAQPAIVRRWASCDCSLLNAYCGARFSVSLLLQGASQAVPVWSSFVYNVTQLRLDVRAADELWLTTTDAPPSDWRPSGAPFSGDGETAPGVATAPQRANICNGAAWAMAMLV